MHGLKPRRIVSLAAMFLLVVTYVVVGATSANASIGNGWTDPVEMSTPYASWLASGCNGQTAYDTGIYHIGRDFGASVGTAVKAIGPGTVKANLNFGTGYARAVFVQHRAADGTDFLVLYGHVNSSIAAGTVVNAGDQVGTIAQIAYPPYHLHLGLVPGTTYPSSNWGRMPCGSWPATNGFVDPIPFLGDHALSGSGGSGGSGDPLADGRFVSYHGGVYRIAGHAPLYVSSQDASYPDLSGWATATVITDDQWTSLRSIPADGTYINDVATGRVYITAGGAPMYISSSDGSFLSNWTSAEKVSHWEFDNWGHLNRYPADGYFVRDVQTNMVYETAGGVPFYVSASDAAFLPQWQYATPVPHYELAYSEHFRLRVLDGTYITDVQTGRTYVTAGGAPLYISGDDAPSLPQWAGAQVVPHWEFTAYQRLRQYPGDGELITNVRDGAVYEIVGGAPMYISVSDAPYFPGWSSALRVPGWDFTSYEHLRQYPSDGDLVVDVQTSKVYLTAGGAPLYVSSSDAQYFPNWSWVSLRVPHWDFQNWAHLQQYPADNTYLSDAATGEVYVTAGGAPLYISPPGGQYLPNWVNAVYVPDWDFVHHVDLRTAPADGTYVQGLPSGEVFQVTGGTATRVTTNPLPPATAVDDWAIVNQLGGVL